MAGRRSLLTATLVEIARELPVKVPPRPAGVEIRLTIEPTASA